MGFKTFSLGDYIITKEGQIISKKRNNKVLKAQPNGKGYLRVHIAGQMYFVHRLVAEKYVPNPENKPQVNHKDGNKLNNNADNLEWVTNSENRKHAVKNGLHPHGECPYAKLNWKAVEFIRNHREMKQSELAELFSVSRATIRDVWNYKSWKND